MSDYLLNTRVYITELLSYGQLDNTLKDLDVITESI